MQSEESIIVRPRDKIANRNPWYDKMEKRLLAHIVMGESSNFQNPELKNFQIFQLAGCLQKLIILCFNMCLDNLKINQIY